MLVELTASRMAVRANRYFTVFIDLNEFVIELNKSIKQERCQAVKQAIFGVNTRIMSIFCVRCAIVAL